MSDFSLSNQVAETPPPPAPVERPNRAARLLHERAVRFHLLLNLGFALAATWVLKLDGPYYADGISAGLFVCGALVSLWSRRGIADSERETGVPHARGLHLLFTVFALFFLSAAVAIVYFTYIDAPDMPFSDEDGLTGVVVNMLSAGRELA